MRLHDPRPVEFLLAMLLFLDVAVCGQAGEIRIDRPMQHDPSIASPERVTVYPESALRVWLDALESSEADLQRQAAEMITKAHEQGMPGLERTVEPLMTVFDADGQHPAVRLAAARALVELDVREAARLLVDRAETTGGALAHVVEPALARWDFAPARAMWKRRLEDPSAGRSLLKLAIVSLGEVGEDSVAPRLLQWAVDRSRPPGIRLESAQAVANLRTSGLEAAARRLTGEAAEPGLVDRLVAASLLRQHQSEEARSLLRRFALDPQPAVAAIGLQRLLEIAPATAAGLAEQTLSSSDAKVRRLSARALVAQPSRGSVDRLAPLLDDRNPGVRSFVRDSLHGFAEEDPDLRDGIIAGALTVLHGDSWRGREQAALLLGALDHEPAAERMVELLESDRPEVFIAAAWGLRRLEVPETLEGMLDHARRRTPLFFAGMGTESIPDQPYTRSELARELSQIFQAFGTMQYRPADDLLRRYLPGRRPPGTEARAAAVWALGHIHADQPDAELAERLAGRLADVNPMGGEARWVRRMAAIALGRMNAEESLETLRTYQQNPVGGYEVTFACRWAIHRMTGEPLPGPPEPIPSQWQPGGFLAPLDE